MIHDFRQYILKKHALLGFKNILVIEKQELYDTKYHMDKFKTFQVLKAWHQIIPNLRENNFIREEKITRVIDQFRLTKLGPKAIKAWKIFIENAKHDKEKEKFRSEIWSKVNGWLAEIDEKHTE